MNPEKTHLYKRQYQQPIEEETPPQKRKSKTAATSDSRKRSKHKHIYKKIILHYGSDSFSWGGQCEICGRLDSTYKSSNWNPEELQVTGEGLYGEWRSICLMVYAYRNRLELAALCTLDEITDKTGAFKAADWTFFVVENSIYAKEIAKESQDIYPFSQLIHFAIVGGQALFEVITDALPIITEGWEFSPEDIRP